MIGTQITEAAKYLQNDQLVAIPTETVYGLAGNALSETAVSRIFAVKNRPFFDPLIVHVATVEQMEKYVTHIPPKLLKILENFSPGPVTVLLPKKNCIPDLVTAGAPRVGIRIPAHSIVQKLLQTLDFPLAAPSANPFGYVSPTTAAHVSAQLGDKIPYILDGGGCSVGIESTIVGIENNDVVVYRTGGIAVESLESVLSEKVTVRKSTSKPLAPGMADTHYAPQKKIELGTLPELLQKHHNKKVAVLSFMQHYPADCTFVLSPSGDLQEAARNLFAYMRILDATNVDVILTEKVPDVGLGKAINDRLVRATANKEIC